MSAETVNIYRIYTLACDGVVFYVGTTSQALQDRLKGHWNTSPKDSSPRGFVLRNRHINRDAVVIECLEETTDRRKSFVLEAFWIEQLRQWGFALCNSKKSQSLATVRAVKDILRDNRVKHERKLAMELVEPIIEQISERLGVHRVHAMYIIKRHCYMGKDLSDPPEKIKRKV